MVTHLERSSLQSFTRRRTQFPSTFLQLSWQVLTGPDRSQALCIALPCFATFWSNSSNVAVDSVSNCELGFTGLSCVSLCILYDPGWTGAGSWAWLTKARNPSGFVHYWWALHPSQNPMNCWYMPIKCQPWIGPKRNSIVPNSQFAQTYHVPSETPS